MNRTVVIQSADFIKKNREYLITKWEKRVRKEVSAAEGSNTHLLRNHLSELLKDLAKSLNYAGISGKSRKASEVFFVKSRSDRHGEARSESNNAYRVDEVFKEYIILRQVLTDELKNRGLDDLDCIEAINRMFELSSLSSIQTFMVKTQKAKQKILSTIIHDIRSPIGVAVSALEILENFIVPENLGKEMFTMIERSLGRSLEMITSSLDHFSQESRSKLMFVNGADNESRLMAVEHDGSRRPFNEMIREADIIVNGSFQDPNCPYMFISSEEMSFLRPNGLIIDVSCDEGMGFPFARATTFNRPMFKVQSTDYYGVDHTPSYLWESASRSISAALIIYLKTVIEGPKSWIKNETIKRAIVFEKGVIQKPEILSFQNREKNTLIGLFLNSYNLKSYP